MSSAPIQPDARALPDVAQDYLNFLQQQRQLSPRTVTSYRQDLQDLIRLAGKLVLTELTYPHLRRFSSQLHAQGLNPRSIARKLSAWRGFYRWFSESHALASNPVDGIKAPKRQRGLPKALGADDAVHLVSQQVSDSAEQIINRAMFELLYSSGLRVSELVGLDVRQFAAQQYTSSGWIDMQQSEVIVTGKGNKQRIVPVGSPALEAIGAWLNIRDHYLKSDPYPLFLSSRGTRMSVRLVQLRLKAHARALAIPSNVHPHVLRHSFASHVLQSSGDLRAVQEMLGHSSIASTQVYTALDFQHLAKIYDAAHPRAKK
jgi:integrase/recombinase XerC